MLGLIYIMSDKQNSYVGSTFMTLEKREFFHKIFSKWYKNDMKISTVKEVNAVDKKHLHAQEQLFINKLKPTINKNLAYDPFNNKCVHCNRRTHCVICGGVTCPTCHKKIRRYNIFSHMARHLE